MRQFLASPPTTPIFDVPDAWQLGPNVDLQDTDGERRPDLLLAGGTSPEQLLFDLDNDTPASALTDRAALVRSRKWDVEFALRVAQDEPMSTAFYDTDGDGTIDVIHSVNDENQGNNWKFTRGSNGGWQIFDPRTPATADTPVGHVRSSEPTRCRQSSNQCLSAINQQRRSIASFREAVAGSSCSTWAIRCFGSVSIRS